MKYRKIKKRKKIIQLHVLKKKCFSILVYFPLLICGTVINGASLVIQTVKNPPAM